MALALPFVVINVLTIKILAVGMDVPLSIESIFLLFPTADALVSLPVSINGVGVREAVFSHILTGLGLSAELALTLAWCRWTGELGRAGLGGLLFLSGYRSQKEGNHEY